MAHTTHYFRIRGAAAVCAVAAACMAIGPTHAAEVSRADMVARSTAANVDFARGGPFDASTYDNQAQTAEWHGRWGWRHRGWHRRGWRHRRGVRAGDVLAGVAIIGGIAAIANAANNRRRERDVVVIDNRFERDREWQQEREIDDLRRRTEEQQREIEYLRSRGIAAERIPQSGGPLPLPERYGAPIAIDTAIDRCVEVIEIDATVGEVEGVDRTGSGWVVTGRIAEDESFTCRIGRDGQIEALENGRGYSDLRSNAIESPAHGQLSENQYADARAALESRDRALRADAPSLDRMPAYPGGPLPADAAGSIGEDFGGRSAGGWVSSRLP